MKHIKTCLTAVRYISFISIILPLFFNFTLGQTSSLKLPTAYNTSKFSVLNNNSTNLFTVLGNGKVGISQSFPNMATLEIGGLNGLLVTGTYNSGTALGLGAGTRLHWYPYKAAFRVGGVTGSLWNDPYIGNYSFAAGYNTKASGSYSFATGNTTTASGYVSFAAGSFTKASGSYSFAMGNTTTAGGSYSFAAGYNTTASGDHSFATGFFTTASGAASFATGSFTTASGSYSFAAGYNTTAGANYSTALGYYVSTNNKTGAFIIGDNSTNNVMNSGKTNQMKMRFNGGYRIYSNAALTTGVYMNSAVSGWTNISDRNKKENFRPLDGELLLEKISAMPITEWNYKGTDESIKYIGPMAQDFYAAFHLGGTDSLGINSIAIDGVNMAAIQSLIKRTDELKKTVKEQQEEISELKKMKAEFAVLKNVLSSFIDNTSPNVKHKLTMNK